VKINVSLRRKASTLTVPLNYRERQTLNALMAQGFQKDYWVVHGIREQPEREGIL
jgi:hypothetical protein